MGLASSNDSSSEDDKFGFGNNFCVGKNLDKIVESKVKIAEKLDKEIVDLKANNDPFS